MSETSTSACALDGEAADELETDDDDATGDE